MFAQDQVGTRSSWHGKVLLEDDSQCPSLSDEAVGENPPKRPLSPATTASAASAFGFLVILDVGIDKHGHSIKPGGNARSALRIVRDAAIGAATSVSGPIVLVTIASAAWRLVALATTVILNVPVTTARSAAATTSNHFGFGIIFMVIIETRFLSHRLLIPVVG